MTAFHFVMNVRLVVVSVVLSLSFACNKPTPIPPVPRVTESAKDVADAEPAIANLEAISKGVAAVTERASKAAVLVSTARVVEGKPFEAMDSFEFFFGPGFGPRLGSPRNREPLKQRQEGVGSGFFINIDHGYIVSNNHVIEGADAIQVKLANGEKYIAKVVGRDRRTDIAVVKINEKDFRRDGIGALSFADSSKLSAGEFAIALGAPFGLEASVSFGVVSAIGRGSLNIAELGDFIQTDAAINPGNSGGPLLNASGDVIGVNTAIFSSSGSYNGVGFAVPSNLARRVAEELIEYGKVDRGYLGVGLQPLESGILQKLGLPMTTQGALVVRIVKDAPARDAGIETGDVIIALDDNPVRNEVEVTNTIALMRPGTKVKLTLLREKQQKMVEAKLGRYPESEPQEMVPRERPERDYFGFR